MSRMVSPRIQFRLSTLFWITLAVACWFGGVRFERWRVEREWMKELEAYPAPPYDPIAQDIVWPPNDAPND
jgi:hypothetical protein